MSKKMKKSDDNKVIVWYIINCHPEKPVDIDKKMFFEN